MYYSHILHQNKPRIFHQVFHQEITRVRSAIRQFYRMRDKFFYQSKLCVGDCATQCGARRKTITVSFVMFSPATLRICFRPESRSMYMGYMRSKETVYEQRFYWKTEIRSCVGAVGRGSK